MLFLVWNHSLHFRNTDYVLIPLLCVCVYIYIYIHLSFKPLEVVNVEF